MKIPRLIRHPLGIGEPDEVMVELYGIRLGYPDGRAARRLDFITTARWLEQGMLDGRPDIGLHLSMALVIATDERFFMPPDCNTCPFWCQVVVAVFLLERLLDGHAVWVNSHEGVLVPAVVCTSGLEEVILTPAMLRMHVAEVTESVVRQRFPAKADYRQHVIQSYQRLLAILPGTDDFCLSSLGRHHFALYQEWAAFVTLADLDTHQYRLKH